MKDHIYVYMKEPEVRVLGPGKRFVLWVQGCNQNCPGCVAESARNMTDGTQIEIDALAFEIAYSRADGITISGGEPFLQAGELYELLKKIHRKRDMGVIVYTGYHYEDLIRDENARKLLSETDLLIDGPYVRELDDGKSMRGSSNQRLIFLTDRYKADEAEFVSDGREGQIFYHGIYVHEIGIPDNRRTEQ